VESGGVPLGGGGGSEGGILVVSRQVVGGGRGLLDVVMCRCDRAAGTCDEQ
jgi:hypothetical protein